MSQVTWPKKVRQFLLNSHFSLFSVMPEADRSVRTVWSLLSCSCCWFLPNIMMLSITQSTP